MGYNLCILAIFGRFQNALIFPILAAFWSRFFAQNNLNVFVETFFACFRQFYFLTQTEYFAWAIAFALCHFWPFSQCSHFLNISCFLEPRSAWNNFNVFLETFFACFREFYFLPQTEYFAWAITFALWPFLAIFKMLLFFEYQLLFGAVFAQKNLNVFEETFFASFGQCYFLTQTEYFAWAIAFALWPFLGIFITVSFMEYQLFFGAVFLHRTAVMCQQSRFSHVFGNFVYFTFFSFRQF